MRENIKISTRKGEKNLYFLTLQPMTLSTWFSPNVHVSMLIDKLNNSFSFFLLLFGLVIV